jgi:tellurite resistance protein
VMGIGFGEASDEEIAVMRDIAAAMGVDPRTAEPPAA